MLANNRLTVIGDSFINLETKIATFGAVINKGSNEISLTTRILDDSLYEANMETVNSDRTAFEAMAFMLQDTLNAYNNVAE